MDFLTRAAMTIGTMIGTGVVSAIVLALYDMDRIGHGRTSFVQMPSGLPGGQTSWGDVTMIACVLLSGIAAWVLAGRP